MDQINTTDAFYQGLNMVDSPQYTGPNYGEMVIHGILWIFLGLLLAWIIRKILYYRGTNFLASISLSLQLRSPIDGEYVGGNKVKRMANAAVMASRVYFYDKCVVIKIPTKAPWQLVPNMEVQELVKRKIASDEFKDYLENNFENMTFSAISKHGNFFKIIGE